MTTPIFLITGGSRGLGRAMATNLARAGADIILTYRTGADDAAAVVEDCQGCGQRAAALAIDTANTKDFDRFGGVLREQLQAWGRDALDGAVMNAGIGLNAAVGDTTEEQFDALFDVHVKGVYFLTQSLLPLLSDGGRLLMLSSGLTRFCNPGYSAYAAAKGAVEVFARYLAQELGPRGISVNTLAPGAIETDFAGGVIRDNPQYNEAVSKMTAMGRVGLPNDIGAAATSLLMSEGNWMTGQRIEVSGGMRL